MSAGEAKKRGFGDIVAVWALETRNVLGSDHLSLPSQDSGGAAGQGEEDKEHKVDKVDRRGAWEECRQIRGTISAQGPWGQCSQGGPDLCKIQIQQ